LTESLGSRETSRSFCFWHGFPSRIIFRRELSLVLEAFVYGDREMFDKTPRLRDAEVFVHFGKTKPSDCKIESWRHAGDYSP
jgi:hypothetical protein